VFSRSRRFVPSSYVRSISVNDSPQVSMYSLKLCYESASGEKCANSLLFRSWGRAKFEKYYAVGTRHEIWLDPRDRSTAEVDLGWNVNTLFARLLCLSVGVSLLFARVIIGVIDKLRAWIRTRCRPRIAIRSEVQAHVRAPLRIAPIKLRPPHLPLQFRKSRLAPQTRELKSAAAPPHYAPPPPLQMRQRPFVTCRSASSRSPDFA
jgi:hypothetical protein